jgi:hypothetical protein
VTLCSIKAIAYSISFASHGKVRCPLLGSPNFSSASLSSPSTISLLRDNLKEAETVSDQQSTQQNDPSQLLLMCYNRLCLVVAVRFSPRLIAAIFCHFLASLMSFFALIILFLENISRVNIGRNFRNLKYRMLVL